MKKRATKLSFLFIMLATGLFVSGCGGGDDSAAPVSTASSDGVREIRITGNDAMQFSVSEIRAKAGEQLRIVLTNAGRMPKQTMAHNWVLFKNIGDAELNALVMEAANRGPEYMPSDMSAVLAHTRMLGPAETDRITITVPSEPGTYPYGCTFPGHFALMRGKLIVE